MRYGGTIEPYHCRAARAWLNWTQAELAEKAHIGLSTVKKFELGKGKTLSAVKLIIEITFNRAGLFFTQDTIRSIPLRTRNLGSL